MIYCVLFVEGRQRLHSSRSNTGFHARRRVFVPILQPPTHTPHCSKKKQSTEAEDDPEEEPELQMQLVWAHTPNYPDEAPSIRLRSVKGLGDAELQEATQELQRHIEVGSTVGVEGGCMVDGACNTTRS